LNIGFEVRCASIQGVLKGRQRVFSSFFANQTAVGENVNANGGEVLQNAHLICQAPIRNSLGFVA
jgi:hypothetical protein